MPIHTYRQPAQVRQSLLDHAELALIDVREEADFATAHPLFAANLPLSKLELEIHRRVPRLTTPLTVYDNGEGLAAQAVDRLRGWGYQDVALLEGGLKGWQRSGGALFQDVNSPSKAFGELVESRRQTPSLDAGELKALIDSRQPVLIVDARRFDEYQTMSIPGGISVPGGELALRIDGLVDSPQTPIVVNCAGRTRSIIGAQSLINAGVSNPVYALRNGTIGWTLAGLALDRDQQRRYAEESRTGRFGGQCNKIRQRRPQPHTGHQACQQQHRKAPCQRGSDGKQAEQRDRSDQQPFAAVAVSQDSPHQRAGK